MGGIFMVAGTFNTYTFAGQKEWQGCTVVLIGNTSATIAATQSLSD
jgi:hypothetical protein